MKKLLAVAAIAVPLITAAPVSAHHTAEGIISDEIYEMIDENLEESPHLELDLTTIGSGAATMSVVTLGERRRVLSVFSVVVPRVA